MELKTYVFLYRRKGSLKRIPASQWRDFLDSKVALPNLNNAEFKTTEIQILTQARKPRALHSIKSWQIKVDLSGFVETSRCDDLPKPQLSIPLSDLFPREERRCGNTNEASAVADIQLAAYLDALFCEPVLDKPRYHAPNPQEVEQFVEQICLA